MKRWGVLFQPGALWMGAHFSPHDRRWCINLLPMVTLWITRKDGRPPKCVREVPQFVTADMVRGASAVARYRQRQQAINDPVAAWRAECEAVARRSHYL